MSMPSWLQVPDGRRIRSFFTRLPLATRLLLLALTLFWVAKTVKPGLEQWGALIPQEINIGTLYRMNTFPMLHKNFFHFLVNAIALTPLLEQFEAENGTVVTLLLFTGPFGLLPGLLYTGLERFVFRSNSAVIGASIWVFLLLSVEAIKTYRQNPNFTISGYSIPTWTTPLFVMFIIHFLVPNTSLLGHLCGAAVGYLWGLGYIRFLAPNEKILRWIEGKLNLLGRLPHYVSVDQKTYGRYGVLPSTNASSPRVGAMGAGRGIPGAANGVPMGPVGSTQRLGP